MVWIHNLKDTCFKRCCRTWVFTFSGPKDSHFATSFKNTLSIKVSKDNSIQSGALGMWPRSTIFGNGYHDLGQGVLLILEFTGTSTALDSTDEIVELLFLFLFYVTTYNIFLYKPLLKDNLWHLRHTWLDILVVSVFLLNVFYMAFDSHYNSHWKCNCLLNDDRQTVVHP